MNLPATIRTKAKTAMLFTLPFPPSANRYWRKTRRGGIYVSDEAKTYRYNAATAALAAGVRPLAGDLALTVDFYRPRKSGDLSNRIKILEDALNGVAWKDDSQVAVIYARRFDDKDNPRVEVRIEAARVNSLKDCTSIGVAGDVLKEQP